MKIASLIRAFALINPFAVRVMARGDALVAYRNVFGVYVPVTGKREQQAIVDYVSQLPLAASRVTKAMIGSPFAFVDAHQGELLQALLTPPPSPIAAAKPVVVQPSIRFSPMSAKLAGKRPAFGTVGPTYLSAVDKRMAASAAEAYQAKLDELD